MRGVAFIRQSERISFDIELRISLPEHSLISADDIVELCQELAPIVGTFITGVPAVLKRKSSHARDRLLVALDHRIPEFPIESLERRGR